MNSYNMIMLVTMIWILENKAIFCNNRLLVLVKLIHRQVLSLLMILAGCDIISNGFSKYVTFETDRGKNELKLKTNKTIKSGQSTFQHFRLLFHYEI